MLTLCDFSTCRAGAEVDAAGGVVAEGGAGAEHRGVNEVVLVEPSPDENAEFVVLPLILGKYAGCICVLLHVPSVAGHHVVEQVLVELHAEGEVGRHEEALVEAVVVLAAGDPGEVGGLSVGVGILAGSVVAFPVDVLG